MLYDQDGVLEIGNTYISVDGQNGCDISMANPIFLHSSSPIHIIGILYDHIGRGKSNMAKYKPEGGPRTLI